MLEGTADRGLRLLGVFAHPDDETFCAGGTLAKYAAAGAETMVVSVTRGQAGQIRDASAATRRTLAEVREQELRRACHALGVRHVECLDYVDGTLDDLDPKVLVGEVVGIVRTYRPQVVLTFGADGLYGHPDHISVSTATTHACSIAGRADYFPEQLAGGLQPWAPARLYHSHFPRSRLFIGDRLARWLVELNRRFRGTVEFIRALSLFAQETAGMRYASDYIDVEWFPPGVYIVEQGEKGEKLYLVLSGEAEVVREDPDGTRHSLAHLGAGEFFGELAIVRQQPRSAHVIAASTVTCLVFSPGAPTGFAGRGEDVRLPTSSLAGERESEPATTVIDVSAHIEQKVAAIAAHRTQYPISPEMFPQSMLKDMFSQEYFLRVLPPRELETELWPAVSLTPKSAGGVR